MCRCIWQVIAAVDHRVKNIQFPTTSEELAMYKQGFYSIAHLPNCIGAIDCTLVPILSPHEREDVFVCRKGYHAINVQAVVNTNMKFTNVVARWPGSTHDNVIFENCALKQWLDNGNHGWLIGDSGYALKRYMLTPKIHPTTRQEIAFNNAHSRTRMVVERAFGILKSRFRCLHKTGGCLQFSPEKCAQVFVVCAKLHNVCIDAGIIGMALEDIENDNENNNDIAMNHEPNAMRAREDLINTF